MPKSSPGVAASVLYLVPAVMVMGNAALIPALPAIRQELHLTPTGIALVITAFSGAAGLALPMAGPLSDRIGRPRVLTLSLLLFGVGSLLSALSSLLGTWAWPALLGGRAVQGLGAAGTQPVAWALAGDLYRGQRREQVLGYMETSNGISKVISPILGGALAQISWPALFVSFTAVSWLAAGVAGLLLPTRPSVPGGQHLPRPEDMKCLAPLVLGALPAFMAMFGLLAYLSEVLETRHHLRGTAKGFALALPMMASSLTSFLVGLGPGPLGRPLRNLMLGFLALESLGFWLLSLWAASPWAFVGLVAVGAGNGGILTSLNVLVTGAVPEERRGAATAFYGTVRFIGVALGPPVFTLAWKSFGEVWALAGTAGLLASGTLVIWWSQRRSQARPQ